MKGNSNNDAGLASPRIPYFFCTHCQARREAVDPGEVYPVCAGCGKRTLELHYDSCLTFKEGKITALVDERPPEAAPVTQTKRKLFGRELALAVLTELITHLDAGLENRDTYHALLCGAFNPFLRELVNHMVIERADWRAALQQDKSFCLRYASQLEEFERWVASGTPASPVPSFIEPEPTTHHETLRTTQPDAPT